MEYVIAKSLHIGGMAVWLGMVTIEAYCWKLFFDADDARARHGVLVFGNQLRKYQEIPAILITLVTGVWLAAMQGFAPLLAQPWLQLKLGCLVVILAEEVTVTVAWVSLQRRYGRAGSIDAALEAYTTRFMRRLFLAALPATAAIGTIVIVAVFRSIPVYGLLMLLGFIVVKHFIGMALVSRSAPTQRLRAAASVAESGAEG